MSLCGSKHHPTLRAATLTTSVPTPLYCTHNSISTFIANNTIILLGIIMHYYNIFLFIQDNHLDLKLNKIAKIVTRVTVNSVIFPWT